MKKKQEKKVQLYSVSYELEGDIDKTIETLYQIKKQYSSGYSKLVLSYEDTRDSYDPGPERYGLVLYGVREETESEETDRELKEKVLKKQQDEAQRKMYESLKKRFDP